jgi:MFS family permease
VRLLIGVILSGTLSILDSTLVRPLLSSIGNDFDAGSETSWLVAGYLLTSTVTIPLWGRWLDLRGERSAMWVSLLVFLIGTIVSMLAPSMLIVIIGRLIQGAGAGGIVPVGQAIISSRCVSDERARLQVYYNISYGAAAGLGPLIGGTLAVLSWRWSFAIVIPVILVCGLLLWGRLTTRPREVETRRFDGIGSALLTGSLSLMLLGVERAWWALLGVGAVIFAVFIVRSLHIKHGLIPASILNSRPNVAAGVMAFMIGFVQFALLTYLPSLSASVLPGINPGLVVVPLTVFWMTLGAVAGMLALRVGTRLLAIVAAILSAVAGGCIVYSVAYASLFSASVLAGLSAGLVLLPLLLLGQHAAPRDDVGAATSFFVLTRNFGGAAGASVVGVLLVTHEVQSTFAIVAFVGVAALLPAFLLPSWGTERALLAVRDGQVPT